MFLKKDLSTECKLSVPQQVHHPLIPATRPTGPGAQVYELMICPDQVSCFVPGLRCMIFTSTACTFRFLGGTRLTLYVTSSPSTGTYSPSILKQRNMWTMSMSKMSKNVEFCFTLSCCLDARRDTDQV